jgi:hypothetical protein
MAKLKISFEVDTTGTSYDIENKYDEVGAVLENIGFLLQRLQQEIPLRKMRLLSSKLKMSDTIEKSLEEAIEDDEKIVKQIFHNYQIDGVTNKGEKFTFTHIEPGYKETLIWEN